MDELPGIVLRPELRANVMLSLREDALGLLDVFKESIPNVFSNHLRLDRLDRDAARAAILGPVERWNELFAAGELVTVEPELVEDVLGQASSGVEKSRIEPSVPPAGHGAHLERGAGARIHCPAPCNPCRGRRRDSDRPRAPRPRALGARRGHAGGGGADVRRGSAIHGGVEPASRAARWR